MNKRYIGILLSATLLFAGCSQNNKNESLTEQTPITVSDKDNNQNQEEGKKLVYTSFYPIYDITKQIVGDKMEVQNLGSLETEAHDWEASAKDLANLNNADLLIINGADMESWKNNVSESSNIEILDTTIGADLISIDDEEGYHGHHHNDEDSDYGHHHNRKDGYHHEHEDVHNGPYHRYEDHHYDSEDLDYNKDNEYKKDVDEQGNYYGEVDPHTWISPIMGKYQAKVICDRLSQIDPENKDYYQENYEKLSKELNDIINEYKEKFDSKENKEFVVPHEAFAYLCRDFGLEQIPLTGITSTKEPDARTMQEVTDKIKEKNIDTIFYEKGGSDKAAKAIANEINGESKPLSTLEFVSRKELEDNIHYQDLIKENLESILKSLEK